MFRWADALHCGAPADRASHLLWLPLAGDRDLRGQVGALCEAGLGPERVGQRLRRLVPQPFRLI